MIPAYTIDTWEEAERLVPAEDYGPPFWLEMAEALLRRRRLIALVNQNPGAKWLLAYSKLLEGQTR